MTPDPFEGRKLFALHTVLCLFSTLFLFILTTCDVANYFSQFKDEEIEF